MRVGKGRGPKILPEALVLYSPSRTIQKCKNQKNGRQVRGPLASQRFDGKLVARPSTYAYIVGFAEVAAQEVHELKMLHAPGCYKSFKWKDIDMPACAPARTPIVLDSGPSSPLGPTESRERWYWYLAEIREPWNGQLSFSLEISWQCCAKPRSGRQHRTNQFCWPNASCTEPIQPTDNCL